MRTHLGRQCNKWTAGNCARRWGNSSTRLLTAPSPGCGTIIYPTSKNTHENNKCPICLPGWQHGKLGKRKQLPHSCKSTATTKRIKKLIHLACVKQTADPKLGSCLNGLLCAMVQWSFVLGLEVTTAALNAGHLLGSSGQRGQAEFGSNMDSMSLH